MQPSVAQAVQLTRPNLGEVLTLLEGTAGFVGWSVEGPHLSVSLLSSGSEFRSLHARQGDWIVRSASGECLVLSDEFYHEVWGEE